jgi:hypothetical protein
MAIKVIDNININKYNINLSNIILSFKGSYRLSYVINNGQRVYIISGILCYYADRQKDPLHYENCEYTINETQLNTNLIEYLYNMVKSRYTNYEDL